MITRGKSVRKRSWLNYMLRFARILELLKNLKISSTEVNHGFSIPHSCKHILHSTVTETISLILSIGREI
jgi:hypothetical protein